MDCNGATNSSNETIEFCCVFPQISYQLYWVKKQRLGAVVVTVNIMH